MEIDVEYAHKVMQIPRAKEGTKILTIKQRPPVAPANAIRTLREKWRKIALRIFAFAHAVCNRVTATARA